MHIERLLAYKLWANELFFATLREVPEDALEAPHEIVFGSLINTANHVFTVDRIFQAHLLGESHGLTTRRPKHSPPLPELWQLQSDMDAWYLKYGRALSTEDLDEIVKFQFVDGGDGAMSRAEILMHIVNHGTYHRGHIGTMLYDMSVKPPTTDYPVFARESAAASHIDAAHTPGASEV